MAISGYCETRSQIKRHSPLRAAEEPEETAVHVCVKGVAHSMRRVGSKDQRMLRSHDGHTEAPTWKR